MGGEPWKCRAPWQADIANVLADARARVFRDKLYKPVPGRTFEALEALDDFFMSEPEFDDDGAWTGEGAESGTCSILDIRAVAAQVEPGVTAPLADAELVTLFGSSQPAAAELTAERESELYDRLTRGDSLYVVLHEAGKPSEVVFYGYSWD